MDRIRIEDLEIFAYHGVFPEENTLGQKFVISADLYTDTRKAGLKDDLAESIHYGEVCAFMELYLKKHTYKLLESAAEHLAEEFDLTGELETVEITTRDPELGTVVVNTSEIDLSDGSWSGKYYEDYPITITAYPAEGCRFVGWKGDVEDGAESLTIPVDGGVSLEAVFQRE